MRVPRNVGVQRVLASIDEKTVIEMNVNSAFARLAHSPLASRELCSTLIRSELSSNRPSMVGRFGSVEIKGVLYARMPLPFRLLVRRRTFSSMRINAGFFDVTDQRMRDFSNLMIADMQLLDILGSWRAEEILLQKYFRSAIRVPLSSLEPYLSRIPWSEVLEGLRVLVVHPFSATIERQYHEKRELLFSDKRVLPRFKELRTIRAVQTVAGNRANFSSWFEALTSMKVAIDSTDYDVAILGCGAYGFPLAAHVKRSGKKAIHMGGATQILFGIRGRRWDAHPAIAPLYNEHWVRPASEDIPMGASAVENGCYW
jgi:hypothetical protein